MVVRRAGRSWQEKKERVVVVVANSISAPSSRTGQSRGWKLALVMWFTLSTLGMPEFALASVRSWPMTQPTDPGTSPVVCRSSGCRCSAQKRAAGLCCSAGLRELFADDPAAYCGNSSDVRQLLRTSTEPSREHTPAAELPGDQPVADEAPEFPLWRTECGCGTTPDDGLPDRLTYLPAMPGAGLRGPSLAVAVPLESQQADYVREAPPAPPPNVTA